MKGGNIDAALVTQDAVKGMHGLAAVPAITFWWSGHTCR
jgi:hypothetical protein